MPSELFHILCTKLDLSYIQLFNFIFNAPISYKIYSIPKKKGGHRIIAHPSKKLKKLQRELIQLLQEKLLIHESAFAYIKGKSIVNNAEIHKDSRFLLKLDFYDFFHSINNKMFIEYLYNIGLKLSAKDKLLISNIFFWNPNRKDKQHKNLILSIGSPSSPIISNAIMYFFDLKVKELCDQKQVKYSRYADDISISGNSRDTLETLITNIRDLLIELFNGKLILNELKTIIVSPGRNKFITGITLTSQGKISIGRKKKRYIFGLVYKYTINDISSEDISHLKGLIAYSNSVEPSLIKRLEKKYGIDIIRRILNE